MLGSVFSSRFARAPTDPFERIAWLTAKCRSMRAKGLAGHWTYDAGLHRAALMILAAERAALAGDETLPNSPDRQDVRAAA
jgi:hypothetical protein